MASNRPFDGQGLLHAAYVTHLKAWLGSRTWTASMLRTKLGPDMEAQQAHDGCRQPVEMAMRLAYHVHAHMLQGGQAAAAGSGGAGLRALSENAERSAWREVLDEANLWLLDKRPRLQEMRSDMAVRAVDFLAEFDRFAKEERLTERRVVVMNCPAQGAWSQRRLD